MELKYILILIAIILLILAIVFRKVLGKVVSVAAIVLIIGSMTYAILGFANVIPVPDWLMEFATKYFM